MLELICLIKLMSFANTSEASEQAYRNSQAVSSESTLETSASNHSPEASEDINLPEYLPESSEESNESESAAENDDDLHMTRSWASNQIVYMSGEFDCTNNKATSAFSFLYSTDVSKYILKNNMVTVTPETPVF